MEPARRTAAVTPDPGVPSLQESCSSGLTASCTSQLGPETGRAAPGRPDDVSSVEEGDSTFHSCMEDSEAEEETTTVQDSMELREDTTLDTALSEEEEEEEADNGVMDWNFTDYSVADHRLLLFCDLSLFREGEALLVLARGELRLRSAPSLLWPGLLVVTNKRIHLLRVLGPETDSPGDWLELRCSAAISRLERLVGLVGAQGLGLELGPEARPAAPTASFYRLPLAGIQPARGDCYYLILRDRDRTQRLTEQLVDKLQQSVRASPIPVTWLTREEESLLSAQVGRACPEAERGVVLFQLAALRVQGRWEKVSVIVTPSHLVLARDFFSWLFQPGTGGELETLAAIPLPHIHGLSVYERWPARLDLRLEGHDTRRLRLETEAGVLQLVAALRGPWEAARGATLEEVTKFHLSGSQQVVVMQTLLTDDSVTPSTFCLGTWIKVTSQAGEQRT